MARGCLRPLLQSSSLVFLFLWPCQIPELSLGRMERESCAGRLSAGWGKVPCQSCSPGTAQVGHCCVMKCSLQFSLQCRIGFHTLMGFFPVLLWFLRFFVAFFYGLLNSSIQGLTPFISVGNRDWCGSFFLLAPASLGRPTKTFWLFFSSYHLSVLG